MASPLEFDLSGLTAEQQAALRQYRGANAAAAPAGGVSQFGRAPGAPISSRAGPGRPSAEARALAEAAAPKPVAPAAAAPAIKPVRGVSAAGKLARGLGYPLAVGLEAGRTFSDVTTPGMTTADQVARGGEAAGRLASMYVGAEGGAALGAMTGPAAPIAAPVGALAGGALGYFAPDLVNKAVNYFSGTEAQLPSAKADELRAAQPATVAPPAAAPAPAAAPVPGGPTTVNVSRQPNGNLSVSAVGQPNATGGVQYAGPAAAQLKGGSFNTISAANFVQPSSAVTAELQAARQAAADRGDFEGLAASYGGDFAGATPTTGEAALQEQLSKMPIRTIGDLNRYQAVAAALGASQDRIGEAASASSKLGAANAQNSFENALKVAGLGVQQQNANTAAASAAGRAATGNTVTSFDAAGNPVIINKVTGRMVKPTAVPTIEEFSAKLQSDPRIAAQNLTAEEIAAAYKEQFGQ